MVGMSLFASAPQLPAGSPISVDRILLNGDFGSFTNRNHPGNRLGYRFHEHHPYVHGPVPQTDATSRAAADAMEEFRSRGGVFLNSREIESTENGWLPQLWIFHLLPVADGIELLWVVRAKEKGLNEFFAVQQCFRMSGSGNKPWKLEIAETPAFSEFELWSKEESAGEPLTSLSWIIRGGKWESLPATREHVACRTPIGLEFDRLRTGGKLEQITHLEPYGPTRFLANIDNGLMARVSTDGKWVAGLFWERTTHISDHHPADCLHAVVNLGPIAPGAQRAIRGKIYWAKMTKEELRDRWMENFPAGNGR